MTESEEESYIDEPMTQDYRRKGLQSESDDEEEGYQGGYVHDFHTQPKLTPSNSSYSQSDLDEQIKTEKELLRKPIVVRGFKRKPQSEEDEQDIIMSEEESDDIEVKGK